MPVILYVSVSPHPQRPPHPKPTLTRQRGYHHDDRRTLSRSPRAEHGDHASATEGLTGGYGRGGRRVYRTVAAPRPSSDARCRGSCHGGFARAPEGGGLLRQRALDARGANPAPAARSPSIREFPPRGSAPFSRWRVPPRPARKAAGGSVNATLSATASDEAAARRHARQPSRSAQRRSR